MKKPSRMTYEIGSVGAFAAWTKSVVRNPASVHDHPKQWFDSTATAEQAGPDQISVEAMVKLLSTENLAVLNAITRHKPASVHELAVLTGRSEGSLSRTLKRLALAGIVAFEEGTHRRRAPSVIARRVHLEIDLTGTPGVVTVDPSAPAAS